MCAFTSHLQFQIFYLQTDGRAAAGGRQTEARGDQSLKVRTSPSPWTLDNGQPGGPVGTGLQPRLEGGVCWSNWHRGADAWAHEPPGVQSQRHLAGLPQTDRASAQGEPTLDLLLQSFNMIRLGMCPKLSSLQRCPTAWSAWPRGRRAWMPAGWLTLGATYFSECLLVSNNKSGPWCHCCISNGYFYPEIWLLPLHLLDLLGLPELLQLRNLLQLLDLIITALGCGCLLDTNLNKSQSRRHQPQSAITTNSYLTNWAKQSILIKQKLCFWSKNLAMKAKNKNSSFPVFNFTYHQRDRVVHSKQNC